MKYQSFLDAVNAASKILVVQADNPDGDSLASSLALEEILSEMGKQVTMYCSVDIPGYLKYMSGWDRVQNVITPGFDLSIIVDTSSISLLENMAKFGQISMLKTKPCVVIDHHTNESSINFASQIISFEAAATGEQIFQIFTVLGVKIPLEAAEFIAYSILSDTLGLTTESVTASTVETLAKLLNLGVNLAKLDNRRKQFNKKSIEILRLKGRLLQDVSTSINSQIATVDIPFEVIEKYSHEYNPSMLVLDEMRMIEGIKLAIAFKTYPDGKITAKLRSNFGYKICDKLAEHFGGGGHGYAAGFKITDGRSHNDIKAETLKYAAHLLAESDKQPANETL